MNFSTDFLPEALTHAIGWALLHSLWQGAMVGIVLALLLILLNRHSARLRYTVSMLGLAMMLVLFGATFTYLYSGAAATATTTGAVLDYSLQPQEATAPAPAAPLWERVLQTGEAYFAAHLPLLVSLWLLGLLVMSLRFLGGMAYIQRLRHYRTQSLGLHWQETLQQVKQSMGVRQSVQLLESALVQVPMAIGYFKPVILFPIGAVTGLSQRQVEAVLAHELAHVLRQDYLFNILQQAVETLFFFHPAVWWMSSMARTEREHCCDDLAVKACGDRVTYARALAQLEALRMPAAPAYAMAFTGSKGTLLHRVKRLVNNADLRPSFGEGFMAALVVVGGFMLLSFGAWAGMKEPKPLPEDIAYTLPAAPKGTPPLAVDLAETEASEAISLTLQDSVGRTSDIIVIKNKKGKITELYVDGKRIRDKDIPRFEQLIDQRLQAVQRAPRMKRKEREATLRAAEEALANTRRNDNSWNYSYTYTGPDSLNFRFNTPPVPPAPAVPPMSRLAPLAPMPPMPPMPPLPFGEGDEKARKQAQERYEREMKKYEQEIRKYGEQMQKHAAQMEAMASRHAEATRAQAPNMRQQEEVMKRHSENMKRHEENMRRHEINMKSHEERMQLMEKVRQEMVKDGLLKEGEQVTDFRIDRDGLYVNGQKQSQALHTKYRNLMKTKDGKSFDMTYKRDGDNVQMQTSQE